MYIFVRFAAILLLILGIVLLICGPALAIYSFVQSNMLIALVNDNLLQGTNIRVEDGFQFYGSLVGAILFFLGIFFSASGQFMLVFVDIANQTRETNLLLRQLNARKLVAAAKPQFEDEPYVELPPTRVHVPQTPARQAELDHFNFPSTPDGFDPLPTPDSASARTTYP